MRSLGFVLLTIFVLLHISQDPKDKCDLADRENGRLPVTDVVVLRSLVLRDALGKSARSILGRLVRPCAQGLFSFGGADRRRAGTTVGS